MVKSESINEIATALSKAQAEIEDATKNAANPHLKSKYANLLSVLEECRPVLSKHGLSVSQTTGQESGTIFLVTTLMHSSGQWLQSSLPLILQKQDMQGLGSALSYARRYSLAAICGISQDDDDGASIAVTPAKDLKPHQNHAPQAVKQAVDNGCNHLWKPSQFKQNEDYCAYCKEKRAV